MKKKKPRARGYWYFTTWYQCPVCDRTSKSAERRYTKKPKKLSDRHEFIISYDHCDV